MLINRKYNYGIFMQWNSHVVIKKMFQKNIYCPRKIVTCVCMKDMILKYYVLYIYTHIDNGIEEYLQFLLKVSFKVGSLNAKQ